LSTIIDALLSPSAALSVVLALIYTLAVHLFLGLGFRGLLWHWLLGGIGMAAGAALAVRLGRRRPAHGDAPHIESSIIAIAALVLAGLRAKTLSTAQPTPAR
jgi:hypothetical protein